MQNFQLKTPVTFIIFKRPETTERVFEAIRLAKPPKLLVIADGPREDRVGEAEKCTATRAIIDRIDWDCEVLKNYSEVNLGCAKRVSSGLNWVFDQVEEAIILEDDCLPHPTFFRFCEELLERYRYDQRIMSISGNNDHFFQKRTEDSYYFSLYNSCWGWATWRRAWQYYDFEMKLWSEIRAEDFLLDILVNKQAARFWTKIFQSVYDGGLNTWAYRWKFACWIQNGLSIKPTVNLISNIGFGEEATHTKTRKDNRANLSSEMIAFPLKHPSFVIRDIKAEKFMQRTVYQQGLLTRTKLKVQKMFKQYIYK
jgi:hypothetical protein